MLPDAAPLVENLVAALAAEAAARDAVRRARTEQARIIGELLAVGVPSTTIVHRIASANGNVLSVAARKRLAALLRQRLSRVTRGHKDLAFAHGQSGSAASPSSSGKEVTQMPKIVKRVTTIETYTEPDESEDSEVDEDADDQDEADEEEETPRRRRSR